MSGSGFSLIFLKSKSRKLIIATKFSSQKEVDIFNILNSNLASLVNWYYEKEKEKGQAIIVCSLWYILIGSDFILTNLGSGAFKNACSYYLQTLQFIRGYLFPLSLSPLLSKGHCHCETSQQASQEYLRVAESWGSGDGVTWNFSNSEFVSIA